MRRLHTFMNAPHHLPSCTLPTAKQTNCTGDRSRAVSTAYHHHQPPRTKYTVRIAQNIRTINETCKRFKNTHTHARARHTHSGEPEPEQHTNTHTKKQSKSIHCVDLPKTVDYLVAAHYHRVCKRVCVFVPHSLSLCLRAAAAAARAFPRR